MINKVISNYKIISKIGEGGMGSVFLAQHQTLDRKAAIKMLNPELSRNEEIRNRFLNEAQTLSKLSHQNIVILYDFAETQGQLYLIMEYVDGRTLDELLENMQGPFSEQRAAKIFTEILSGFAYAHKKGIIHRDIKPSNIMLEKDDTPKILDFGIAKILEGDMRLTKTGTRMGSVLYMSPEQILAKQVDIRTDIYSLGITLFEMLAGKLPYDTDNESEYEIQSKIVKELIPPIRSYNPSISEKFESIINRATAKDPSQRFQNCEEFMATIQDGSYQGNITAKTRYEAEPLKTRFEPISPTPTFVQPRTGLILGMKPAVFGIVAVIVVSLIIALVIIIPNLNDDSDTVTKSKNNNDITSTNKTNSEREKDKTTDRTERQEIKINDKEVYSTIESWREAWENKNIQAFSSYYDVDFSGCNYSSTKGRQWMNRNEWLNDKTKKFNQQKYISITISFIEIKCDGQDAVATFEQLYSSGAYSDTGRKELHFKKKSDNQIKITYENFFPD